MHIHLDVERTYIQACCLNRNCLCMPVLREVADYWSNEVG